MDSYQIRAAWIVNIFVFVISGIGVLRKFFFFFYTHSVLVYGLGMGHDKPDPDSMLTMYIIRWPVDRRPWGV